jgi:hypothetical protein
LTGVSQRGETGVSCARAGRFCTVSGSYLVRGGGAYITQATGNHSYCLWWRLVRAGSIRGSNILYAEFFCQLLRRKYFCRKFIVNSYRRARFYKLFIRGYESIQSVTQGIDITTPVSDETIRVQSISFHISPDIIHYACFLNPSNAMGLKFNCSQIPRNSMVVRLRSQF